MITVIYGPSGSGKTTNAHYLKGKFGCKRVVDEWVPGDVRELHTGDLVLTQQPEELMYNSLAKCIHIAEALR